MMYACRGKNGSSSFVHKISAACIFEVRFSFLRRLIYSLLFLLAQSNNYLVHNLLSAAGE